LEAIPLPSPLPLLRIPFSTFSAPNFDRNSFAARASPALLFNIAPVPSSSAQDASASAQSSSATKPSEATGSNCKSEPTQASTAASSTTAGHGGSSWLNQIPFSTLVASFLGQHATVSFEHQFWRCSEPFKTAFSQVLGSNVWGPGDLSVPPSGSTSLAHAPVLGGHAYRQCIGMDSEAEWLQFGVTEPRLAVFRPPKSPRKIGGDKQGTSGSSGPTGTTEQRTPTATEMPLLNTMSTTPFASMEYFLLLSGGPVDWTAAAGGSDDQDFRKSLRTIQHLNIA